MPYLLQHSRRHHVVLLARISLTLSRHFSLPFIAPGRSSVLHPVSSHSCCMQVRAGRPAFAWPYAWVHRSTSLMSSSLLLQQCLACLVRLTCIVFVMGGKWPYSCCLVGCCRQDLFNIALNILVLLPSSFFFTSYLHQKRRKKIISVIQICLELSFLLVITKIISKTSKTTKNVLLVSL